MLGVMRRASPQASPLLRAQLLDQRVEHFQLVGLQVRQRGADRAGIVADQFGAGLDDADGIAGAAVADLQVGQEELCLLYTSDAADE